MGSTDRGALRRASDFFGAPPDAGPRGQQVSRRYWNTARSNRAAFSKIGLCHVAVSSCSTKEDAFGLSSATMPGSRSRSAMGGRAKSPWSPPRARPAEDVPAVAPCAKSGETIRVLVVKTPNARRVDETLVGHGGEHLAGYEMPRQFIFARALPKSNLRKIL